MEKTIQEMLRELIIFQCELESDRYFLRICNLRGIITKEDMEKNINEINEKMEKVTREIERLSTC